VRQAAAYALSQRTELLKVDINSRLIHNHPWLLMAMWQSGNKDFRRQLPTALSDPDPDVRFVATRWIADDQLTEFRPNIEKAMGEPVMTPRLFAAYIAALERLDGKGIFVGQQGTTMEQYLLRLLADPKTPPAVRTMSMKMLPSENQQLKVETVREFLKEPDADLRTACVRWLAGSPDAARMKLLAEIAVDKTYAPSLRAEAVAALGADPAKFKDALVALAGDENKDVSAEAKRTARPPASFAAGRPAAADTAAWLKLTEAPGDAEAGRRIFFNRAVAACSACHTIENRGAAVGPDLTMIGHQSTRESVLKSILEPSAEIAPRYVLWTVTRRGGETFTGMLLGHSGDDETYIDPAGQRTKLPVKDVVNRQSLPISPMPPNQLDGLTDQEIRDLLAFLMQKR
jgi:putative heme-binding domain-containing protein